MAGPVVSKAVLEAALPETALLIGGKPVPDPLADESDSMVKDDSGGEVLDGTLPEDVISSRFV